MAGGTVEGPAGGKAIAKGKILFPAASRAFPVDAGHGLLITQARRTHHETDHREGRYEHEMEDGQEDAARGHRPEGGEGSRGAGQALAGRRSLHAHSCGLRRRPERGQ